MIAMAAFWQSWLTGEPFGGERVLDNTVRFVTMLFGLPIALICLKFGVQSLRRGQPDRAWGTLSYAFVLLVPAVGRAMNFGNPINWVTTALYVVGLVAAGIALFYRAQWLGWRPWKRRRPPQEKTDE